MERNQEQKSKTSRLAREVIRASQDKIVANMRFLDAAVFALRQREADPLGGESVGLMTDGTELIYVPESVIRRCRDGLAGFTHDYLHVLLHCIFRHYFIRGKILRKYWDLAADIAVEEVIDSFHQDAFRSERSARIGEELIRLRREIGSLTAEKVYRWLIDEEPPEKRLRILAELFCSDEHDLWYEKPYLPILTEEEEAEDSGSPEDGDPAQGEEGTPDSEGDLYAPGAELSTEQDWEEIAQMVKTAIEAGEGTDEGGTGRMLDSLKRLGRRTIDYSTFLKKFASRRETLKVDDSSFDYIFYTYGLELYGDMPLVEPLEYTDERQIRDLVLVIDSSASTEGELVQSFVEQTFDILLNSKEFRTKFNVRLIQCDAEIQEDVTLRSRQDVERYLETIEIKGLGGTDFRSAFRYVDELVQQGAFTDLKGLIYFTDGKGTFPKRKPSYDAAFVFADEDSADRIQLPPWAIKVVFGGEHEY